MSVHATADEKLVRMANQIGGFFDSMPDRAEAVEGVAQHLKKFWTPSMRRALVEHVERGEPQAVRAIVAEAVRQHRTLLHPA